MKRTSSVKRVARKIGVDSDDEDGATKSSETQGSVVKRPIVLSKSKKSSKSRISFGGAGDDESADVTPRKSLGRQAIERNAEQRAGNEDRPSYSKDSLAELKNSTPSTPKNVSTTASEDESALDVQLASKFGPLASQVLNTGATASHIPTVAEIKEKKERRARLAAEKDFVSLNPSDSEEERKELLLRPKEKYAETRLVRDDEDLAEGFDEYVEDGKIALGRKAERAAKQKKREEMRVMIEEAEAESSEDESGREENEAFEAGQTRAGNYAVHRTPVNDRPRTPPKITPVPDLATVLARMRAGLEEMKQVKSVKERRMQELEAERKEIKERGEWIQTQLKEVGARYEKLRTEAGMTGESNGVERGLESFGGTPAITPAPGTPMVVSDSGEDYGG